MNDKHRSERRKHCALAEGGAKKFRPAAQDGQNLINRSLHSPTTHTQAINVFILDVAFM